MVWLGYVFGFSFGFLRFLFGFLCVCVCLGGSLSSVCLHKVLLAGCVWCYVCSGECENALSLADFLLEYTWALRVERCFVGRCHLVDSSTKKVSKGGPEAHVWRGARSLC